MMNEARKGNLTPQELLDGFIKLNRLESEINTFYEDVERDQPKTKGTKLTHSERKSIYGLYHSGEYKQSELAEIYDVKQPTISAIVRSDPDKYIKNHENKESHNN